MNLTRHSITWLIALVALLFVGTTYAACAKGDWGTGIALGILGIAFMGMLTYLHREYV